jgi:hypothetical protein
MSYINLNSSLEPPFIAISSQSGARAFDAGAGFLHRFGRSCIGNTEILAEAEAGAVR